MYSCCVQILTIVVVARDSDSYAGQPCGEVAGRTVHVDVTGLTRCCKEVNCSKGKSTCQTYVQSIPLDQGFMQDQIIASHTCFGGHMDVNC